MSAPAHLCLGVGACTCCRDLIEVTLNIVGQTDETVLTVARAAVEQIPGVAIVRPLRTEPWSTEGEHYVVVTVEVVDPKLVPEERHFDCEDGPSVPGGLLEAVMDELVCCRGGGAGWVVNR